jgi:hypothetical protein
MLFEDYMMFTFGVTVAAGCIALTFLILSLIEED